MDNAILKEPLQTTPDRALADAYLARDAGVGGPAVGLKKGDNLEV
jgi:hypothetical protein